MEYNMCGSVKFSNKYSKCLIKTNVDKNLHYATLLLNI